MHFQDFLYCVSKAVEAFQSFNEDKAWKLARAAVDNNSTYRNLFSEVLKEIIGKSKLPIHWVPSREKAIREKAILLFLIDWNLGRFIRLYKNLGEEKFNEYLSTWESIINNALNSMRDLEEKSYYEAFQELQKSTERLRGITQEGEYIPLTKLLMVINPNKFIAWDNQIAEKFSLSPREPEDFHMFNILIDNFIQRNANFMKAVEDYISYRYRYRYEIKRILDMIFYLYANKRLDDERFQQKAQELIDIINTII